MKRILALWLSPAIYLSGNWISLIGVVIVTTASILWLCLLPVMVRGEVMHPYAGILTYFVLPGIFIGGLLLIPLGMYWKQRHQVGAGIYPSNFPPLNLHNKELRKLIGFAGVTTVINVVIASQLAYGAVNYMDSVTFCGTTCHTVMKPEFTAHQGAPHAQVECVKCHIGSGAGWFLRSKLSGLHQLYAVTFHTYATPIATPVRDLRPAREICETCHWQQEFVGERIRDVATYADDEKNSLKHTVLLLHIGGGSNGVGIHSRHLGEGIRVRYTPSDGSRQVLPWVEYTAAGQTTVFAVEGAMPRPSAMRQMDCLDCHNRPAHVFQLSERAVDGALLAGEISATLPFAKRESVQILKKQYTTEEAAASGIPAEFESFYKSSYPEVYVARKGEIEHAGQALLAIFQRNVFPKMKITWGTYPNNIGHTDFDGCFRCHDELHKSSDGRTITQDCAACHNVLAMEEAKPKILMDLGVGPGK